VAGAAVVVESAPWGVLAEIWMPDDDDVLVRSVTLPLGEYRYVGPAVWTGPKHLLASQPDLDD
jgi:hypothetical protein